MPIIRKILRHAACAQLTVPREILHHLNINVGDYVVWAIDAQKKVVVDKLTPKNHPGYFVPGLGWIKNGAKK